MSHAEPLSARQQTRGDSGPSGGSTRGGGPGGGAKGSSGAEVRVLVRADEGRLLGGRMGGGEREGMGLAAGYAVGHSVMPVFNSPNEPHSAGAGASGLAAWAVWPWAAPADAPFGSEAPPPLTPGESPPLPRASRPCPSLTARLP